MPAPLSRLGRTLVLLAIAVTPLLVLPPRVGFINALDTPRRLLLLAIAGALAALLVLAWGRRGRLVWRWHPLDLPVGLFTLAVLISAVAGAYPAISLWGPLWNHDGLLYLVTMVLLYVGAKHFLPTVADVERAAAAAVLAGGLVAVIGLADFLAVALHLPGYPGLSPAFSGLRLVATLGNPMFTGTYLAMLIPLGMGAGLAATSPQRRAALLGAVLVMLPALLLTQARAAWVGLAVTIPIFLWMVGKVPGRHRALTRAAWAALLAGGILVVAIALVMPAVRQRVASMVNMEDATVGTRLVYMTGAARAFGERPVQGWGIGAIRAVFPQFRPASTAREQGMALDRGYSTAQPHNLPLQLLAETGLLGFAAFGWLIVSAFIAGGRLFTGAPRPASLALGLLGLLTAYLATNLFTFDNAVTLSGCWLALGLLAALSAADRPLAAPLSRASARGVTLAGVVILLGTLLHVGTELTASALTLSATRHLARAGALLGRDPQGAFAALDAAERALRRSLPFTARPGWRGMEAGDVKTYQIWTKVLRTRLDWLKPDPTPESFAAFLSRNTAEYDRTATRFAAVTARGLRLLDRDPFILRDLAQQHLQDAKIAVGLADETRLLAATTRAHAAIETLHRFEPFSAEVYLLEADLAGIQGMKAHDNTAAALSAYAEAEVYADRATTIDPTFPEAFAVLAAYQNEQVARGSADTPNLVLAICRNYARAEQLGLALSQEDLLVYATNLFLAGQVSDAIRTGARLEPERRAALKDQVRRIFRVYQRPAAEVERTLTLLDAGEPAPATPPAPARPLVERR